MDTPETIQRPDVTITGPAVPDPEPSFIARHPKFASFLYSLGLACTNIAGEKPTDNTPVIPPAAGAPDLSGLPPTYPCPFPYNKHPDGTCGLSVCPFADPSQGKLFDRDEDGECDIDEGFDPVKNQVKPIDPCVCPSSVPDRNCRPYADSDFCLRLDGGVLDLGPDGMRDFAVAYDASRDISGALDRGQSADATADASIAPDATSRDAADSGAAIDYSTLDTGRDALDGGVRDTGVLDTGTPDTPPTDGGSDIASDAGSDAALDAQAGQ